MTSFDEVNFQSRNDTFRTAIIKCASHGVMVNEQE